MKVKLSIELELPDSCKDFSHGELQQLIFDEYINHATCAHLEDAMKWLIKSQADLSDVGAKLIYEMHNNWADICKNATWSFTA